MSEVVFVEEYRKELEKTGYPFTGPAPVVTSTGYRLPAGTLLDASVYYEDTGRLPQFTELEKKGNLLLLRVGDYQASLDLTAPEEVLELQSETGLPGGILVCDTEKIRAAMSWRNGVHPVQPVLSFCPRALELIPPSGVQRLVADSGEIFSGNTAVVSGQGGVLTSGTAPRGFPYLRADYTGDPTYYVRAGNPEYTVPVQQILCIFADGTEISLVPDGMQSISWIACNIMETVEGPADALRISSLGSELFISLGGL
jgi:hypothetical protein